MQWNGCINNETICQDNQADIATCERLADEVGAAFVRDMAATCHLAREDACSVRQRHIAIAGDFGRNIHIVIILVSSASARRTRRHTFNLLLRQAAVILRWIKRPSVRATTLMMSNSKMSNDDDPAVI